MRYHRLYSGCLLFVEYRKVVLGKPMYGNSGNVPLLVLLGFEIPHDYGHWLVFLYSTARGECDYWRMKKKQITTYTPRL